jgi:hypothetical protein
MGEGLAEKSRRDIRKGMAALGAFVALMAGWGLARHDGEETPIKISGRAVDIGNRSFGNIEGRAFRVTEGATVECGVTDVVYGWDEVQQRKTVDLDQGESLVVCEGADKNFRVVLQGDN